MLFSVIYSVDIPKPDIGQRAVARLSDTGIKPPGTGKRGPWKQTEKGDQGDYDFEVHHAKWCAMLTREQFDDFVSSCDLYSDSTPTAGSLGAPGFGMGWAPAVSFNGQDDGFIRNAYVTPLPAKPNGDPIRKGSANERDLERVSKTLIHVYKNGVPPEQFKKSKRKASAV